MTSLWKELEFSLWLKFRVRCFLKKLNILCVFLWVGYTLWLLPHHTEQNHKKHNKYFIIFYNPLPMLGNVCLLSNSHSGIPWERVKGRHFSASLPHPPTPEHQEDKLFWAKRSNGHYNPLCLPLPLSLTPIVSNLCKIVDSELLRPASLNFLVKRVKSRTGHVTLKVFSLSV